MWLPEVLRYIYIYILMYQPLIANDLGACYVCLYQNARANVQGFLMYLYWRLMDWGKLLKILFLDFWSLDADLEYSYFMLVLL